MKNLVDTIKNSGLVAVPTETVYGLACNGLDPEAVEKVYQIKGRPEIKPLSLMVHDLSWIDRFCLDVPYQAYLLAEQYWPGPLTIVLKSNSLVPSIVKAGGSTVGLRCPDSSLTLDLINEADVPLAAPSANPSGYPSAKSAEEVYNYFGDSVEILDGGLCAIGVESTIIDLSSQPFKILREGAVSSDELTYFLVDNMSVIGITGQTGSGKSFALEYLEQNGFVIIDCDCVYHDLLNSDESMLNELTEEFPTAFNGKLLDRKKLSDIVFNDKDKLSLLNEITHKYVISKVSSLMNDFAFNGYRKIAVEAIELISSGLSSFCDKTIGIIADESIRINRVMDRDGLSYEEAYNRIKSQKDNQYFINNCDSCIYNNSDRKNLIEELMKEVDINE